jgi:L-asparaginase II
MHLVEQTRGSIVEAVHPFSAVAVDGASGAVVGRLGPEIVTTWRSASKPFQLENSLAALGDASAFSDEQLAVGAASHSAEPVHVALVEGLLRRFGLDATALRCGAHPPVHEGSAEAILRAGGHFGGVHNNCSGKHSFMLGACVAQGWSLEYRPLDHPLQAGNHARLEALCGDLACVATDGCGVPTFGFELAGLARAWGTLAAAMAAPARRPVLARIGWAMAGHPELTSGTGRLDLQVVRAAREPMAVKIGALGVFCMALPERGLGLGLAVKVHSGSTEALAAAVTTTLETFATGAFAAPEGWGLLQVRNVVGDVVGGWRVRQG